jgi:peptide deformylase
MMKLRIIGDEVLRQVATAVTDFDENLAHLVDEMIDTMHSAEGIGLAAPQVGISRRLLVIDISPIDEKSGPRAFINPVIMEATGECQLEEGCLSIPDVRENVTRPERILLRYQTVTGEMESESFDGWMARVLQHEIDHLNGVLFVDYLSPVKKKLISRQFAV